MPFVRVGTSCFSSITGGTDYNFWMFPSSWELQPAYWLPCRLAITRCTITLGARPQSIQGQSHSHETTSLGTTLARPHAAVRAPPILAGTGSLFHLPDKEFRYLRTVHRCCSSRFATGANISVALCTLLCRSDYIIRRLFFAGRSGV